MTATILHTVRTSETKKVETTNKDQFFSFLLEFTFIVRRVHADVRTINKLIS
jgi:hypothetical protein